MLLNFKVYNKIITNWCLAYCLKTIVKFSLLNKIVYLCKKLSKYLSFVTMCKLFPVQFYI